MPRASTSAFTLANSVSFSLSPKHYHLVPTHHKQRHSRPENCRQQRQQDRWPVVLHWNGTRKASTP
jgi:hypothetical protein